MRSLAGKTLFVTGSSRGIGKAIALRAARDGAAVVLAAKTVAPDPKLPGTIHSAAEEVEAAGGRALPVPCDVRDEAQVKAAVKAAVETFGRLDILVNNAATNPYFGPILDTPADMLAKTVDVNLTGFFHLCQLAGRVMREQGGGVILNTSSVNGAQPAPGQGVYSMTKAGIISMTRAFARECAAFGIRVNAVLPGLTDTKFAHALTGNEALLRGILPMIPLGRVAEPEEIAPAFLYLACDASAYVTGACLAVDGGLLA